MIYLTEADKMRYDTNIFAMMHKEFAYEMAGTGGDGL